MFFCIYDFKNTIINKNKMSLTDVARKRAQNIFYNTSQRYNFIIKRTIAEWRLKCVFKNVETKFVNDYRSLRLF